MNRPLSSTTPPTSTSAAPGHTLYAILVTVQFWTLKLAVSAVLIPLFALWVTGVRLTGSHRRAMHCMRRAISWYGAVILRCAWPHVKVVYHDFGRGDGGGPFIFVCNHRSSSDPYLMACLPFECIQIVNMWPLRLPVLGPIAGWAGYLSIRELPVETFFERAGQLLAQGCSIIAFPEGTRSGTREMGPFHGALFRLALQHQATLAPIAIAGNEDIPHKGSLILHPGTVTVHKLPAVKPDDYQAMRAFQLKNYVRKRIQKHLAEIEGKDQTK